jgi:hypothetical protein
MVMGIHLRCDFFIEKMIDNTRLITPEAAVQIRKRGHKLNHKDHISMPGSPANCATVAPPAIRNI